MAKYNVVAYPEEGLLQESVTIEAKNEEEAWDKAWRFFPEYHEVGVWEV